MNGLKKQNDKSLNKLRDVTSETKPESKGTSSRFESTNTSKLSDDDRLKTIESLRQEIKAERKEKNILISQKVNLMEKNKSLKIQLQRLKSQKESDDSNAQIIDQLRKELESAERKERNILISQKVNLMERNKSLKTQLQQLKSQQNSQDSNAQSIDRLRSELESARRSHEQYQSALNRNKTLETQVQRQKLQILKQSQHSIHDLQLIAELKSSLKSAQREKEQYRFAAIALKYVAKNLPSAQINRVEWAKCNVSDHMTQRTLAVEKARELIHQQPAYSRLSHGQYIIENNGLNADCQYNHKEIEAVSSSLSLNGIGNMNWMVVMQRDKRRSPVVSEMNDVLGIRKVVNWQHAPILKDQQECFAKMDIPSGTILGQYVGNEMLKNEYHAIFNGTKEEMEHLTYMHGDTVQLPDGRKIDVYVDGIASGKSPFLYINDGRSNLRKEETEEDAMRMNVQFMIPLANGWPIILLRTTKAIKSGDSLYINYGPRFGLVLDEQALVYDQRQKTIRSVDQILKGIDLAEDKPLHIFADDVRERGGASSNINTGTRKVNLKGSKSAMGRPYLAAENRKDGLEISNKASIRKRYSLRSSRKRPSMASDVPLRKRRKIIADSDDSS